MATPQPPTRITVSGGPKVESRLSQRPLARVREDDPYRMAHRKPRLTAIRAAIAVLIVLLILAVTVLLDGVVL